MRKNSKSCHQDNLTPSLLSRKSAPEELYAVGSSLLHEFAFNFKHKHMLVGTSLPYLYVQLLPRVRHDHH